MKNSSHLFDILFGRIKQKTPDLLTLLGLKPRPLPQREIYVPPEENVPFGSAQLLDLVNRERLKRNLPQVVPVLGAQEIAYNRALIGRDEWSHQATGGRTFSNLAKVYGYKYGKLGEIMGRGHTDPQRLVNQWLASPSHQQVLLNPTYRRAGVYVLDNKGKPVSVAIFSD